MPQPGFGHQPSKLADQEWLSLIATTVVLRQKVQGMVPRVGGMMVFGGGRQRQETLMVVEYGAI